MSNVNRGYQLRAFTPDRLDKQRNTGCADDRIILDNPPQQAPANDTPPEPAGTGWRAPVREMHSADDYVEEHIVGDPACGKVLRAGGLSPRFRPYSHADRDPEKLRLSVRACRQCLRGRVCPRASLRIPCIVAPLAAATYVGTSRLVDDRHFLSGVVFGATLGESIGWTIVGRHGRSS